MGEIRNYICNCGYQKELYVGAGINARNLAMIAHFFPEESEQFLLRKQAGEVSAYLLGNTIVTCRHCKQLDTVPFFSYKIGEKEIVHKKEACAVCGEKVHRLEEEKITCPKCGRLMSYQQVGNWD